MIKVKLRLRISTVHKGRYGIVSDFGEGSAQLKSREYYFDGEVFPTVGDFVLVRSVPHRIEEWSVISEISIDLTEDKPPQIAFGAISTGLTAPERTASINRWLVSLQGQAPLEVYAIDLDGYYAIDSDGYYAVADGSGL